MSHTERLDQAVVPAEARCVQCGVADGLTASVKHAEAGAYNVEPVFVCEHCRPQHDKDVSMTAAFRKFAPRETWSRG